MEFPKENIPKKETNAFPHFLLDNIKLVWFTLVYCYFYGAVSTKSLEIEF